jgi:hypothetical protein
MIDRTEWCGISLNLLALLAVWGIQCVDIVPSSPLQFIWPDSTFLLSELCILALSGSPSPSIALLSLHFLSPMTVSQPGLLHFVLWLGLPAVHLTLVLSA